MPEPNVRDRVLGILAALLPPGDGVSLDTGLRERGLDSLATTRLWFQLRKELGVDIPVPWLGRCRSATELIARVQDELRPAGPAPERAMPIESDPAARFEPFPLTDMQQAYLIGKDPLLSDDPIGCHVYREIEVAAPDATRLRAAWQRVVVAHDMLRVVLTPEGQQRVQERMPAVEVPVHLRAEDDAAAFAEHLATVRARLSHQRYEPGSWPMFALELSLGPAGRGVVHLSIDALLLDGHGLAVILDDLWQCYCDPDRPLPAPELTVRDCVVALAAQQRAPEQRHLDYWVDRLAGLPAGPDLGGVASAPAPGGRRRCALTGSLDREQWRVLRELAGHWDVSPTALVLTLFAEAFAWQRVPRPFSLVLTTSHRARLPDGADRVVGPFTSSIVLPLPNTLDRPLREAARVVHDQLWQDLDHAPVSGVAALRAARARDRAAVPPPLPVVFTSLLGTGRSGAAGGFGDAIGYALSQTSGVALDHQMWEQDGELRFRWDVVAELFPDGALPLLFATFVNSLYELSALPPEVRPLNELQQAYFVPRALAEPAPWDGCQVYHSFVVDELDLDRLESAWLRLVAAHDVLRTTVTPDGRLSISPDTPRRRQIPVIALAGLSHPDGLVRQMRDRMVGWAFPLGRSPHSDLRVTVDQQGTATVHVTIDLTIVDGRSIHFLVRELFRLYADRTATPALPASREEYLAARAAREASPDHPRWTAHWRDRVAALPPGPLPPLDTLAADRTRERREGRLADWRALRQRVERAKLTPDDLLVAAFTQVLATHYPPPFSLPVVRWTGDTQRYRPGEYTALSWVIRENASLPPWEQAAAIRRRIEEDVAADSVEGLAELRRRVMRERRSGRFDLPVVYTGLLDLSQEPLPAGVQLGPWLTCTPGVSLDCIGIDEDDELRFYWDAVPAHFPEGRLDEMFGQYQELLERLAAGGSDRLSELERRTILYDWNDTAVPFPDSGLVHQLFEEQARRRPDAVALRWAGGTMTYAELNRRANRIAWSLRRLGVGPEVPVGISLPRRPDMVAAVFGVLKAGGFYVPLEPSLPQARAEIILADATVPLVLTTADRPGWVMPEGVRAVLVEASADERDDDPEPRATVSSTAYVIFTSGSTGKPKGVQVAHRPLLNLLNWCSRTHGFGPEDVGLCVTSLGFDLSVFDILGLLGCGAGLYLADETEQRDPQLLLDVLLREPITFWNSAPTSLNQLAPLFSTRIGAAGAETLRLVYLSGDYTPLPLPDEVRRLFPNARIVSLGGATEATVWSNWFEVGQIDPSWRSVPYGRPIDNARYYVLDEGMEPCPVGVEGDLYIGGECLSRGYYGQPELTWQRFIPDPFGGQPDGRLYRTGDRASYFADGTICFLGRADRQVKIRGFRVELAEIEHRLRAHPEVKDVVILARADPSGDRNLVAYVVSAGEAPPRVSELRRHAAETLPDYMVPNVIAFVDNFPATPNGKLDRDALPWPVEPGSSHVLSLAGVPARVEPAPTAATESEPARPTEPDDRRLAKELAAIFADLLGVAAVGLDDDVWDLGATSFTMVQVSGALLQRHGRRVPVEAMLADPTVAGIVRAVSAGADANPPAEAHRPAEPEHAAVESGQPVAPVGRSGPPLARSDQVDFFSAAERDAFKQARWDLRRRGPDDLVVALDDVRVADEHFAWRASRRELDQRPIPYRDFSRLLGLLREVGVEGRRRRLYPSAGDTYAVQAYLHVRPGAVEGVPEGLYYYHPTEHALHLVNPTPRIDRSTHFVYNRPIFDRAGFELYLFGPADAIEPVYGAESERFMLLESGYVGQLLLLGQSACGVGLCPIGTIAVDGVRAQLGLDERHRYLQSFLGGPVGPRPRVAATGERPLFAAEGDRPAADGPAEVAIVGVAGRYPGADDLESFWGNLSRGVRSLTPVPASRWDQVALAPAPGRDQRLPAAVGGYLSDVDGFDSLLFQVAPAEAPGLDPQLRLLLHTAWECLEDAGHTAASLSQTGRVGVFLGAMWQDYQHVGADRSRRGDPATISATGSEAANRISHFFGFSGPSVAVDTSCSSSLAALHLAVASLRRGECESAVVAAANLLTHPYHLRVLTDLGLLADGLPAGAFDGAGGWTPGEGVAAVLLRTRTAAERDGDAQSAIVEATRIGHTGGAGGRFGTPRAAALGRSIADTLADAGVPADEIEYVECAAAGAALADAAEIEALSQVFAARRPPVPIGTVKPNIGHLEAAAGLSQLTKVLLQMRHRQIAPTLMSDRPSPLVSWEDTGLRPADRLTFWAPTGGRQRALINAVGATGSYGHVVLRAADRADAPPAGPPLGRAIVPLSAQSPGQLAALAGRLQRHLLAEQRGGRALALADVAFTLQSGRVHMPHRLAVSAADMAELIAGLDAVARGGVHPSVETGCARPGAVAAADAPTPLEALPSWLAGREVDWSRYWPRGQARRVSLPTYPFAAERHPIGPPPAEAPTAPSAAPAGAVAAADRRAWAEQYLIFLYAELSGVPADRLDARVPLEQYGLSSSLIVQLNARLAADLGEVPSTLFFAHPDLAGAAEAIADLIDRPPDPEPDRAGRPAGLDDQIAIIGIAGQYPRAPDLRRLWQNLLEGHDAITDLPPARRRPGWPEELMVGGFLDDVSSFDPLFFGITPRDAASMDPQERLFLEVAWHTLEDAGYTRARLRERHGGRAGVFVGSMYNEYPFFGLAQAGYDPAGRWSAAGSAIGGIANRVSYFLDLNGPSMTVDTMCSSSLTAIHLAVTSLRRGECEVALAGGVNLSLHPNKFVALRDLKMSSTDHRCRSFGADGDGFVPGEGVGAVLLKPFVRAVADGDRIHAVIRGTAINHDGKTNGYTVPSPVAQGSLVVAALRDAGVPAQSIGYLEAHGTGTALGDPIELDGLDRAFADAGLAPGSCAIGSIKSSIGHLEAAAGIAGLTKVVLQLRHGMLVPSLHAERLNPSVDWARSPFRVQREAAPWPGQAPRRAGISSFGAGGANAHLIVEEYRPAERAPAPAAGPELVVLSARTDEQLREMAGRLAAFLREGAGAGSAVRLADLAYTLQVGREAMRERLAVLVDDESRLPRLLERFAAGGSDDAELLRGRVARPEVARPPTAPDASRPGLNALARRWVEGAAVDWSGLHLPGHQRIVDLPGYPFARTRCWVPEPGAAPRPEPTAGTPLLVRAWRPEAADAPVEQRQGRLLCLLRDGQGELAAALAKSLHPAQLLLLREGIDYDNAASAVDAVRDLLDRGGPLSGVLDLCALPEAGAPTGRDERDEGLWGARLAILQRVLADRRRAPLRVLQATSGLLDLPGPRPDLTGARLAGFVRSLGAEYRWARATVVDVDRPERARELAAELADAWRSAEPYGEICLRGGLRHRPCLVPAAPGAGPPWRPDSERVYLITGGTRGLGSLAARHLVRLGARRLAILGLRPLPPRHQWTGGDLAGPEAAAVARLQELERLGARVMLFTGPLTRRDDLDRFLTDVRASLGEIAGVLHCAGRATIGPAPLVDKELADIRRVLEPKADGLDTLVELTGTDRLDFFVLFSSVSATVAELAAGVADYAAANAYLDRVAAHQVRSGRSCFRAVSWPVWRETGGGADRPDAGAAVGLDSLSDADGLAVLERVLALPPVPRVFPCPTLPGRFDAEAALRVNCRPEEALGPPTAGLDPAGAARRERQSGAGRPSWLVELFARELGIPEEELPTDTPFGDLGVESVRLAELLTTIEARLGRPLEPTALLDHPTLDDLGAYLVDAEAVAVEDDPQPGAIEIVEPVRPADRPDQRVAVIGMACRFPGAPDLASFWRLLRAGQCVVTEVPPARWDAGRLYHPEPAPGSTISKWGGFVDDLEDFDPEFFGISGDEAKNLDPAIRLMLEATAGCMRDAGYRDEELRGADVGVFVGARMSGYRRRIGAQSAASGLGGDQNFIAARVAHQYDFRGPSLVVDSACSSALVGVQLAVRSLMAGESSVALAGAVEVLLDEEPYLEFSQAGALSPRGRCATFSRDADGFVPGEGCGVLLLKPLQRALSDGDRVHAVIDAVAVGNDGRTMGLTTPNPDAQARVVRRALELAGVSAQEVGMLEAHGTATMIGDPIELRALTRAFRADTDRVGFCAIGSVKSNVGHLLSAAGMAGLVKALLALEHGQIPATLFCETPNPRFDFAASPFLPSTEPRDWPAGRRVAGVSAFGLGGTNAHLIATAAPEGHRPRRAALPAPVFTRRRLWWDPVPAPPEPVGNGRHPPLVASVLDLRFGPAAPGRGAG